jgi:hypothetical protein
MKRYLTKSRFKLASECPTKLFYTRKPDTYPDEAVEDSFLAALAEGGHQVGALAQMYWPDGEPVDTLDVDAAVEQTAQLLKRDSVTIFEAAIRFENLLVRVDVLSKSGNRIELIEVKAKSCAGGDSGQFVGKRGRVSSEWRPYLEDVTFQKYVLEAARPAFDVHAHLMLVDKTVPCPTDGLHQKFLLVDDGGGRTRVKVSGQLEQLELESPILRQINVNELAEEILAATDHGPDADCAYGAWVEFLADHYERDSKIVASIGTKCGACSFRASDSEKAKGQRSGFEECWSAALKWNESDFGVPTVLEIGNFRRKGKLLEEGKASMLDLTAEDIGFDQVRSEEMTTQERQWMQVSAAQSGDQSMHLRRGALVAEMSKWTYPLHFIDFETATPAIPFHQGLHAYEPLAFQYSHHTVDADGHVEHCGEYLDTRRDVFPNFDFVRNLKRELESDHGTIFRYAAHENTILAKIRQQLLRSNEPPVDASELINFIETIAHPTGSTESRWNAPERDMVDLLMLVKRYYYDPAMGGSNSIKKVLPAILNGSEYLQEKYQKPIYGGSGEMPSLNFSDKTWVEHDTLGRVQDPYELLPTLFGDATKEEVEALLSSSEELRDGGAAMTAYARMQFTEMLETERTALGSALLKYCELDTLAMVMIFEAWREWCRE